MSEGITQDCAMLWRTVAGKGGWWSVLRLTREWAPTFSLADVERHLVTLRKGGFLEAGSLPGHGTVYAYSALCHPLPGAPAPLAQPDQPTVPGPRRPDVMHTTYTPPVPVYRPGALDYQQCPSLHMGRRRDYRGQAAGAAPAA
jgi:hypothetical protein